MKCGKPHLRASGGGTNENGCSREMVDGPVCQKGADLPSHSEAIAGCSSPVPNNWDSERHFLSSHPRDDVDRHRLEIRRLRRTTLVW